MHEIQMETFMTVKPGFRLGIYVFKDAEIVDYAAPHGVFVPSNDIPSALVCIAVTSCDVFIVDENWPDCKNSFPPHRLHQGVSQPSNDIPVGLKAVVASLAFMVEENWPDWRYNLSASSPIQGVSVPSQEIPCIALSTALMFRLAFIVEENWPDWSNISRSTELACAPHQGVLVPSQEIPVHATCAGSTDRLALIVDVNCPDWRYSLPVDDPSLHHGVAVVAISLPASSPR